MFAHPTRDRARQMTRHGQMPDPQRLAHIRTICLRTALNAVEQTKVKMGVKQRHRRQSNQEFAEMCHRRFGIREVLGLARD
ncbi:hypothetical protein, partial [Neorhodopirellula lusitana]|uniref:hypothetical protein n=1 Tax=Neorhodopirellula lusitana TaxID=445327 RepID=UPI00384FB849